MTLEENQKLNFTISDLLIILINDYVQNINSMKLQIVFHSDI